MEPEKKASSDEQKKIKVKRARRRLYEMPDNQADITKPAPIKQEPAKKKPSKRKKTKPGTTAINSVTSVTSVANLAAAEGPDGRETAAKETIHKNMAWSMGIGLLPFPVLDAAVLVALQVRMVRDISRIYRVPFSKNRGKSLILSLLGEINAVTLARFAYRGFLKYLPGFGSLLGMTSAAALAGATTYGIGKVFVKHFELGGTLLDFDPQETKAYFRQQFEKGMQWTKG
jgi:uncharacterized protein (DUF697 family)